MKMSFNDAQDPMPTDHVHVRCDRCEDGILSAQPIQSAFWRGMGLVVIRNIPAMICPICGEEYVSDQTAIGLDRMRGAGFTAMGSVERMIVPVLDYSDFGGPE
jgi:hypothetical protein